MQRFKKIGSLTDDRVTPNCLSPDAPRGASGSGICGVVMGITA